VQGQAAKNLIKIAAHNTIQNLGETDEAKQLSLKHQVICDQTAIVGVLKQADKATGDM